MMKTPQNRDSVPPAAYLLTYLLLGSPSVCYLPKKKICYLPDVTSRSLLPSAASRHGGQKVSTLTMVDARLQQPSGALHDRSSNAGGDGVGGGGVCNGVGGTVSVVSESEAAASEAVATRRGKDALQVRTRSQDEKRPPSPSKVHAEKQWLQNAEAAAELEPKAARTALHDYVPVEADAATISGIGVRAEEEFKVQAERPSRLSRAKENTKALIDPKYDAEKLAHGVELPWTPTGIDRLVISPGNRLVWVFDCLIIVCVLTTAIFTPMEVAYRVDHILGRGVDIAIDVLYLVDMALQCVHGYQDGGYPVLSLRRVALRYAHSWLLIDLVSVLPWEFIAQQLCENGILGAPELATLAAPLPREAARFWLCVLLPTPLSEGAAMSRKALIVGVCVPRAQASV